MKTIILSSTVLPFFLRCKSKSFQARITHLMTVIDTVISSTASRRLWLNNDYWCGNIVSEFTTFKKNSRAIEFMKYTLNENFTFDHWEFYEDDNQLSQSNRITIWTYYGLKITQAQSHGMDEFCI